MTDNTVSTKVLKRAGILGILIALLLFGLLIRVLFIQTVDFERYQGKVIEQLTTESKVNAKRGEIFDANGVLLATNVTRYRVFISPSTIAKAQNKSDKIKYDELIAKNLSEILGVPYDKVLVQTTYVKYLDRTIKKSVEEEDAQKVREFIDEYDLQNMVYLEAVSERYYPHGALASHVIGFTGSDGEGLYGLEYQYNKELKGSAGKYIVARDAQGNEMPYAYDLFIEAENGKNITTTLDVFVQAALEQALKDTYSDHAVKNRVCGIVLDVNNGDVKGMATYPNFNLNSPWELNEESKKVLDKSGYEEDSEEYNKLRQSLLLTMWSNKAVTESYIPGSTFKIITSSMALEENRVSMSERVSCHGSMKVSGFNIHCHKVAGHGSLTFSEGLQQSCNVWFMTLGQRIGTDLFTKYFKSFGYKEKTGIDLPGEGNSIISSSMSVLDLSIYAFGQNFNVTPIQQIMAVSSVANGGYLMTPHFLKKVSDSKGNVVSTFKPDSKRQVISSSTSKTLAEILEGGVSGNGGAKNAYVPGYRIAAKTGTSEKKGNGDEGFYVCSCVGFAPADNPRYAVIIMADEPTEGSLYGSTVAAPYVGQVFESILPYLGVEPVYSEKELENMAVTVPSVKNWSITLAENYLKSLGLEMQVIGNGEYVKKQFPEVGTVIEKVPGKVIVYTESDAEERQTEVPNLIGMTAGAANKLLSNKNINVKITGTRSYLSSSDAYVSSQSLKPGNVIAEGTKITIELVYYDKDDITPDVGG